MKQAIDQLIVSQRTSWDLARVNYGDLPAILSKEIILKEEGYRFLVQFNPGRVKSSVARTDAQSIRERKCFLCAENRPAQQQGLCYPPDYDILLNPYPIFPRHLTIPSQSHTDQRIATRMGDMLRLAKDLPDFVVFYNGPRCGASAPDHLHFQAGSKGLLPIEHDAVHYQGKQLIGSTQQGKIYDMENYLRQALIIESNDWDWLTAQFNAIMRHLCSLQPEESEPMLNLLSWYDNEQWRLVIFPRVGHRPRQFFASGEEQLLFSPASVDFGGLLTTIRLEDFDRMDADIIQDMFSQLTFPPDLWGKLKSRILN